MKKQICRFFLVLLVGISIELIIFRGPQIIRLLSPKSAANQELHLSDFETANWEHLEDGRLCSGEDPILVVAGVDAHIDKIEIDVIASRELPYIDIFYINKDHPQYGELYQRCGEMEGNHAEASIDDHVQDLRLDLGDDAGLTLYDLTVRINPVEIDISIARIAAIIFIYWSGAFLFSLQKAPDYGLDDEKKEKNNET